MRKYSIDVHRVHHSVRLVVTLLVLLGFLVQNVAGSAYMSLLMEPYTTVTSPPVILQDGTAGESTIYEYGTSMHACRLHNNIHRSHSLNEQHWNLEHLRLLRNTRTEHDNLRSIYPYIQNHVVQNIN